MKLSRQGVQESFSLAHGDKKMKWCKHILQRKKLWCEVYLAYPRCHGSQEVEERDLTDIEAQTLPCSTIGILRTAYSKVSLSHKKIVYFNYKAISHFFQRMSNVQHLILFKSRVLLLEKALPFPWLEGNLHVCFITVETTKCHFVDHLNSPVRYLPHIIDKKTICWQPGHTLESPMAWQHLLQMSILWGWYLPPVV